MENQNKLTSSIWSHVKNNVPIINEIKKYIKIRKKGAYYVGHCPFCKNVEKALTINENKQIYYCHECHEAGDVIMFVVKKKNITPKEALIDLSERYSLGTIVNFY